MLGIVLVDMHNPNKTPVDSDLVAIPVDASESPSEAMLQMAEYENGVIDALAEQMASRGLTEEALLGRETSYSKLGYEKHKELVSDLCTFVDYYHLRGIAVPPHVEKMWNDANFSRPKNSTIYAEAVNSNIAENDVEAILLQLADNEFYPDYGFFGKLTDETAMLGVLTRLLLLPAPPFETMTKIAERTKDVATSLAILSALRTLPEVAESVDAGKFRMALVERVFHRSPDIEVVRHALEEGILTVADIVLRAHDVKDDAILALGLERSTGIERDYLMRYVLDPSVIPHGEEGSSLELMRSALTNPPKILALGEKIYTEEELSAEHPEFAEDWLVKGRYTSGKFCVGVSEDGEMVIAWSNQFDNEYHKDVFRTMERVTGKRFPLVWRSGGMIELRAKDKENKAEKIARMQGSSGAFGAYNTRLLGKYADQIRESISGASPAVSFVAVEPTMMTNVDTANKLFDNFRAGRVVHD